MVLMTPSRPRTISHAARGWPSSLQSVLTTTHVPSWRRRSPISSRLIGVPCTSDSTNTPRSVRSPRSILLAAHHRGLAGLGPQLRRLGEIQHGRLVPGVVFEQHEIFEGAMQRHLVRLHGHLIEPRQVKGGFVDAAVLVA